VTLKGQSHNPLVFKAQYLGSLARQTVGYNGPPRKLPTSYLLHQILLPDESNFNWTFATNQLDTLPFLHVAFCTLAQLSCC